MPWAEFVVDLIVAVALVTSSPVAQLLSSKTLLKTSNGFKSVSGGSPEECVLTQGQLEHLKFSKTCQISCSALARLAFILY